MARATGLSAMTISRIWRAFRLQPHRTETFKLSPDPLLIEKVSDIVGLYLQPPAHAVVLCADVKPQIQALDRSCGRVRREAVEPKLCGFVREIGGRTGVIAISRVQDSTASTSSNSPPRTIYTLPDPPSSAGVP